jgi:hypothetical protein
MTLKSDIQLKDAALDPISSLLDNSKNKDKMIH